MTSLSVTEENGHSPNAQEQTLWPAVHDLLTDVTDTLTRLRTWPQLPRGCAKGDRAWKGISGVRPGSREGSHWPRCGRKGVLIALKRAAAVGQRAGRVETAGGEHGSPPSLLTHQAQRESPRSAGSGGQE